MGPGGCSPTNRPNSRPRANDPRVNAPEPFILGLSGGPAALGHQHGTALRSQIHANIAALLGDFFTGANASLRDRITAWQRRLRTFCYDHWPWMADEIRGLAEGAAIEVGLAELLSFRAWQYEVYHAGACSSFALPRADGTIVTGGTLDDPRWLYAITHVAPDVGLRFISFPIAGTVWASRGLNEAGLALGISSLICSGVRFGLEDLVPVDLVFRDMLQTCSTVTEVEDRCRRFKFFCNLIAVDRHGGVFASSNYCGAYTAHPPDGGRVCLTNHPVGAALTALETRGYGGPPPGSTTTGRHALITAWMSEHAGRVTLDDAAAFLGATPHPDRVNNPHTAFATIAMPQTHPQTLWLAQQPVLAAGFRAFDVRSGTAIQ